jgi:hypothetical protein
MLVTAVCIWYVHVRVLLSTRRVINASANQSSGGLLSIERTKGALYIVLMFSPALFTFGIVMLLLLPGSVSIYSVILAYSVTALFGSLLFVTFRLLKAERLSRLLANREAWLLMLFVVIMACVSIFTATFFIVSAILPII